MMMAVLMVMLQWQGRVLDDSGACSTTTKDGAGEFVRLMLGMGRRMGYYRRMGTCSILLTGSTLWMKGMSVLVKTSPTMMTILMTTMTAWGIVFPIPSVAPFGWCRHPSRFLFGGWRRRWKQI